MQNVQMIGILISMIKIAEHNAQKSVHTIGTCLLSSDILQFISPDFFFEMLTNDYVL